LQSRGACAVIGDARFARIASMARPWNIARDMGGGVPLADARSPTRPREPPPQRRNRHAELLERCLLALVAQHDLPWPQINRAGPGASSMRGLPEQRPMSSAAENIQQVG